MLAVPGARCDLDRDDVPRVDLRLAARRGRAGARRGSRRSSGRSDARMPAPRPGWISSPSRAPAAGSRRANGLATETTSRWIDDRRRPPPIAGTLRPSAAGRSASTSRSPRGCTSPPPVRVITPVGPRTSAQRVSAIAMKPVTTAASASARETLAKSFAHIQRVPARRAGRAFVTRRRAVARRELHHPVPAVTRSSTPGHRPGCAIRPRRKRSIATSSGHQMRPPCEQSARGRTHSRRRARVDAASGGPRRPERAQRALVTARREEDPRRTSRSRSEPPILDSAVVGDVDLGRVLAGWRSRAHNGLAASIHREACTSRPVTSDPNGPHRCLVHFRKWPRTADTSSAACRSVAARPSPSRR